MDRGDISRQIGLRIKQRRISLGLSQEAAALEAELHPSYYGCLERGEKCPTIETLYKISGALDVPLTYLLELEDSDKTPSTPQSRMSSAISKLDLEQQERLADIVEQIIKML